MSFMDKTADSWPLAPQTMSTHASSIRSTKHGPSGMFSCLPLSWLYGTGPVMRALCAVRDTEITLFRTCVKLVLSREQFVRAPAFEAFAHFEDITGLVQNGVHATLLPSGFIGGQTCCCVRHHRHSFV